MSFRIERGQIIPTSGSQTSNAKIGNVDFQKVLQESLEQKDPVKISAHAQQRMAERNINLQERDMDRLYQAMNNLEQKGAKESLMLYKDMAFIASVSNRTIITALQDKEMEIVTNIDSAIVVK